VPILSEYLLLGGSVASYRNTLIFIVFILFYFYYYIPCSMDSTMQDDEDNVEESLKVIFKSCFAQFGKLREKYNKNENAMKLRNANDNSKVRNFLQWL
jgi:hypothetical protein